MQQNSRTDIGDLIENWPYYAYNISAKNDPNQHNELAHL